MNDSKKIFKNFFLIAVFALYFFSCHPVTASTTDGTIVANSYAWGENLSWINFGLTTGNIHVTNTAVTGYAWSQNYGWINLSPTNGGVTNNTSGQLGGYAWSSGLGGWIPFDGVTINSSGKFTGTAGVNGSAVGRINFDCTYCSVVTDWRPGASPTSAPSSGTTSTSGGAAGGGGGAPSAPTPIPTSITTRTFVRQILIPSIATSEAIPSVLFDILTESLSSQSTRNIILRLSVLILSLFFILLFLIIRFYRYFRNRKITAAKLIKKIK